MINNGQIKHSRSFGTILVACRYSRSHAPAPRCPIMDESQMKSWCMWVRRNAAQGATLDEQLHHTCSCCTILVACRSGRSHAYAHRCPIGDGSDMFISRTEAEICIISLPASWLFSVAILDCRPTAGVCAARCRER